ncbi:MAG: hemin uptake protein HemP [Pseudomonadota bacterium]|jgi:hemin uptake protein HemP
MDGQRTSPPPALGANALKEKGAAVRSVWCSEELFSATNEVVILHGGEEYRLRITRNNKLILTK